MLRIPFVILLLFPMVSFAETSSVSQWHLPQKLSDENTTIRFEVDSTWHTVHGTTAQVSGTLSLSDPTDPTSIRVALKVPVDTFDTDNSMRDKRMNEVMSSDTYPVVTFVGKGLSKNCTPARVLRDGACDDELLGRLTILAETEEVSIPITIHKIQGERSGEDSFAITGSLPIRWGEYGVEDPSILIARLDPVVTVSLKVTLKPIHSLAMLNKGKR